MKHEANRELILSPGDGEVGAIDYQVKTHHQQEGKFKRTIGGRTIGGNGWIEPRGVGANFTWAILNDLSLSSGPSRIRSWAGSVFFHGMCVAFAAYLMTDLPRSPRVDPIHLDIAMIKSAPPETQEIPKAQEIPKTQEMPAPTPVQQAVVREQRAEAKPVAQVRPQSEPVSRNAQRQLVPEVREVQHVQPVHQSVSHMEKSVQAREPVRDQHKVHSRSAPVSPAQAIRKSVESTPEHISAVTASAVVADPVKHIFAQSVSSTPVATEAPRERVKPVVQSGATSTPAEMRTVARAIVKDGPAHQVRESPAPVVAQENQTPTKESRTVTRPNPRIRQRAEAVERLVQAYPEAQADFGWLAESIWSQIEKYKRYPAKAKQREWEGKVVVEAVIREDGMILALHVAESSGYDILDQNALDVLWKLSPLTLAHPLGRPQLTILVPLTYRLDS
jgi:periplasmic protein TonB